MNLPTALKEIRGKYSDSGSIFQLKNCPPFHVISGIPSSDKIDYLSDFTIYN